MDPSALEPRGSTSAVPESEALMRSRIVVLITSVACATPHQRGAEAIPPSPLLVADPVRETIAFRGVDFALSTPPTDAPGLQVSRPGSRVADLPPAALAEWARNEGKSDARVLEQLGYRVRLEVRNSPHPVDATTRFSLAGRLVGLIVSAPSDPAIDSSTVDVRIEWTLFDTRTHDDGLRLTADAHVAGSGGIERSLSAATAATLREFLADSTVRSSLTLAAQSTETAWRRPSWNAHAGDTITLTPRDVNVDTRGSALAGAVAAVVSLRGSAGVGSAFLLTRDGLAITNYHVVRNQRSLTARFRDGVMAAVRVVRADSRADLALVEIACPADCYTVDLYGSIPSVGEDVFAIGSPVSEQFSHSVTKGIVSGVRRRGAERLLQTDAAVNRGNSGGPLIEARTARVVGIVSEKLELDGIDGMGFAIAVDDALRVLRVRRDVSP
jgi:S1-C subfamily serine protease